jgi:hypothetical protein
MRQTKTQAVMFKNLDILSFCLNTKVVENNFNFKQEEPVSDNK